MNVKLLRETRAKLGAEIRKMAELANDEKHVWTAENEENWKKLNADFDAAEAKLSKAERSETVDGELRAAAGKVEIRDADRDLEAEAKEREARAEEEDGEKRNVVGQVSDELRSFAIQAWMMIQSGISGLTRRHKEAIQKTGINPGSKFLDIPLYRGDYRRKQIEFRAPMSTSAGTGGETIPTGFEAAFEQALLAYGALRQVARIYRTSTGNAVTFPTTNDTGNKGAILGENSNTTDVGVTTSGLTLNAYKYTSKIVLVPHELIEDSAFDLASMMGSMLGERIARITNDDFTTGAGTAGPKGAVTAATTGVTTASATAITSDEILGLIHSVDPAYRDAGTFMLSDAVLLYIRKLRYSSGNEYIFNAPKDGPSTLFGKPLIVNQSMASTITANDKTILYGDFSKFLIRDVGSVRLMRLVERYAEYDQEAFVAFSRHDSDLLDAGTHPLKLLLQHA